MARRCGCAAGSCSCVLQGGDGVTVTGSGSVNDPYVIHAADVPLTGKLQVQDTNSVDLSLTGQGTTADPYVLTADASLALGDVTNVDTSDTTVGYVLARQSDGSFAMVPPSTASVGSVNTDASLDGDGSSGNPLTVHDYPNLARLEGTDRDPGNMQSLILGDLADEAFTAFAVRRKAPDGYPNSNADIRMRIYASGPTTGSHGVIEYYRDGADETDLYFLTDGQVGVRTGGGGPVRPIPYAQYGEELDISISADAYGEGTVTFPNNRFTTPPLVLCTVVTGSSSYRYVANPFNVSTVQCTVRVGRADGGSSLGTWTVHVHAIQMDPV